MDKIASQNQNKECSVFIARSTNILIISYMRANILQLSMKMINNKIRFYVLQH